MTPMSNDIYLSKRQVERLADGDKVKAETYDGETVWINGSRI